MTSTKFQMAFDQEPSECSPDLIKFFMVTLPFTLFLWLFCLKELEAISFLMSLTTQPDHQEPGSGHGALLGGQAPLLCVLVVSGHFNSSVFSVFFTSKKRDLTVSGEAELDPSIGTAAQTRGHCVWSLSFIPTALGDGCPSLAACRAECVTRIAFLSW